MNKLLSIILLFINLNSFAQTKTSGQWMHENPDKVNHFSVAYISSFAVTTVSYHILSEYTDIKPIHGKIISGVVGFSSVVFAGLIKEKNDKLFNPYDMEANKLGALAGTITIEIIVFRMVSERQYKKIKMDKLNE